jgi:hypothetical protein
MIHSIAYRLEQYTLKQRPPELLLVNVEIEGEADQIAIFKGFSSSLMRPTAFDPDLPVLPENATIFTLDRLVAPYNPQSPQYIQQGLTWEMMQERLQAIGI